ncbi:hypothetical protein RF11_11124 [Thelohanellus kitauei]|uniref:DUF4371 domain-containing protein n=1 Tax=Thelohanellus kitauei TaxID=669202 RepID=A0A0C2N6C4_THEKT|nr:hypothetical protein RF11_11124 [Thelohanellus kitauei]
MDFNIIEKLLALHLFKGTTPRENIYKTVNSIFDKYGLKWSSLSGIWTDGAPSMGCTRQGHGSKNYIRKCNELSLYYPSANLCAKSIKFRNVMEVVVGCTNFIKSHELNPRQFKEYLEDIFFEYEDVSYYTEASNADCLDTKGYQTKEIKNAEWSCDLAFLVDVTGYLNELNIKLQKQGQLVHQLHGHVKAFTNKLRLLERQIRAKNCFHFPTLATHTNIPFDCYGDELKSLIDQFDMRFIDFQNKDLAFTIFARPLDVDINCVPEHLQMELIELQADLKNIKIYAYFPET